jgi:hypothetical protein
MATAKGKGPRLNCRRCQKDVDPDKVLFLCPGPRCPAKEQPPPDMPARWTGRPVFRTGDYKDSVRCPFSPHRAGFKICPHCGEELRTGGQQSTTIALVGASSSGKTCYMTALLRQIRRRLAKGESIGMSLEFEDDESRNYFREKEAKIFKAHEPPPLTVRGGDDMNEPEATMYLTVRFPVRGLVARLRHGEVGAISLVIPDPSGELFEKREDAYALGHYVGNARAILLMMDPWASDAYRERRGGDLPEYSNPGDALNYMIKNLRSDAGEKGKLDQALAVVLTKCDEEGMFDPDDPAWKGKFPPQGRTYSPQLAREISDVVVQYAEEQLELANVVAMARSNFKNVCFFAASALGSPPILTEDEDGNTVARLRNPEPRRVEEPLLWVLHQWGYL